MVARGEVSRGMGKENKEAGVVLFSPPTCLGNGNVALVWHVKL